MRSINTSSSGGARAARLGLRLSALLFGSAAVLAIPQPFITTAAMAQTAPVSFSIQPQPLATALSAFIRASGWQVGYASCAVAGKSSPGVSGTLAPRAALEALLAGTGVSVRIDGAGSATLVAAPSAGGDDAALAPDGSVQLETINVTGAGSANAAADAPYSAAASSAYISAEQIERYRGSAPGDVLRGIPGVQTGATHEKGALDVNVRGMQGMDRVPVIVDGTRQSQTVYEGYAGVASRTYVDPDLLGGITIEKGPSAAADAVGATGGVARMTTITADDILLEGRTKGIRVIGGFVGNTVSAPAVGTRGGIDQYLLNKTYQPGTAPTDWLAANNFDRPSFLLPTSFHGSVAGAVRNDSIELLAAYARRSAGNYFAGGNGEGGFVELVPQGGGGEQALRRGISEFVPGEEILSSSYENESLLLKGKASLDQGHTLNLSYMKFRSAYVEYPWPGVTGLSGGLFENLPSHAEVDTVRASYAYDPDGNDLVNLKVNAWLTNTQMATMVLMQQQHPVTKDMLQLGDTGLYTQSLRFGIDAANTSSFSGRFGELNLNYGLSYSAESLRSQSSQSIYAAQMTMFGPVQTGNRTEASAFISSEWRPFDWLKLEAAYRHTRAQTVDDCGDGHAACYDDTANSSGAPIFAATLEPWNGVQLYGRYAEAIRLPSLFESIRGVSFSASPVFTLKPEHARNTEVGFNLLRDDVFAPGDSARLKLAYFDNNITDYITRRRGGPGEPTYVLTNLDHARFRGVEISAGYDIGRFSAAVGYTRYLDVDFCGYAGVYGHLCGEEPAGDSYVGLHLPPRDSVSLTASMRLLDDKLNVGGRLTYNGERVIENRGRNSDAATWNPYTLVDVFATYQVNENLKLDIGIDNVTDQFYVAPLSILSKPGPGRTFRASLTAKF